MRNKILFSGAAALLAASATPASAAVVFDGAYVYTSSYANAYASGSYANSNASDSDAQTLPTAPLEASSFTSATAVKKLIPQAIATNGEDATATFASAASGTVEFNGASSGTVLNSTDTSAYAYGYGYSQFYYNFTIDSDYNLKFDYTNSSTPAAANNLYYYIYGFGSGSYTNSSFLPSVGTGSFATLLTAGSYQLGIYDYYGNQDYAYQGGSAGTTSAERNDLFAFNLTSAVPEPASWAIMLAGFAMIGGALRSRRGRKAAAAFA